MFIAPNIRDGEADFNGSYLKGEKKDNSSVQNPVKFYCFFSTCKGKVWWPTNFFIALIRYI